MEPENTRKPHHELNSHLKKLIIPTHLHSINTKELPSENRNVLLVAATLIATVTFQAGITPPGGIWQDNNNGHIAGRSIYSSQKAPFYIFLISNSLAFTSSIFLLLCLTFGYPFFLEVFIASASMMVTYGSSIYAITPDESVKFRLVFLSATGTILLRLSISLVAHIFHRIGKDITTSR